MEWLDRVQEDPRIGPSAFSLAYAIARHLSRAHGCAWPAQGTLGAYAKVKERQVRNLLRQLQAAGYLRIESGGFQTPDRYFPTLPNRQPVAGVIPANDCRSGETARQSIAKVTGNRLPPNPLKEPSESKDANASFVGSIDPTLLAQLLSTLSLFAERASRPTVKRRTYPDAFEAAWKAYPHHVNRSSKPDSLTQWRKLPQDERDGLADACQRFRAGVSETCGGKGAPDMARWLRAGKHLNWIQQAQPAVAKAWDGPDAVRAAIALQIREGFAASYVDTSRWRPVPPTIIAPNEFMAGKLRKEAGEVLERLGVRVAVAAAVAA
ncbi:MAG: hypothetical protein KA105_09860 [Caulobacter sp.]|nr:hypothetical protein [Caulobacter sp.]